MVCISGVSNNFQSQDLLICLLVFIKFDNSLWGFGDNSLGQLGLGSSTTITSPTEVTRDVKVIKGSSETSFFIKLDNKIFSTGSNNFKELGLAHNNPVNTFTQLQANYSDVFPGFSPLVFIINSISSLI